MKSIPRQLLPALLLWAMMLVPLIAGLAHGSVAHTAHPAAVHEHVHLHDHAHHPAHDDSGYTHTHGADHSHDPGKMLPTFVIPGIQAATLRQFPYHFSLIAAPPAPFERPPRT
ncbi:hypothetical protein [Chitinimonas sp. BJYL2]|uniref:hypothetical protein n=1 Tax=Chitinimonas sp. BJYL2 TaxID=2976696 RepID=UPI0022B2D44F|nr:hypothetical protein [Chitinimonas sp. BJYL2]